MPVYSVKKPPVSSCSASTRSNGGWLVSATAEITKITSATIAGSQYQSPLKIDLKPSQPCWITIAPRRERVRLHEHTDDGEAERGFVAQQLRRRPHRAEQRVLRTRRPPGEQHAVEAEPRHRQQPQDPEREVGELQEGPVPGDGDHAADGHDAEREERGEHRQVRRDAEDAAVGGVGLRLLLEEQLDAVGQRSGAARTGPARSGPMRFCISRSPCGGTRCTCRTESSSSTNTAIVLPMMISTTVVSRPCSSSGSATREQPGHRVRLHPQLGDRRGDVDEVVRADRAPLRERHERGAGRGGGVGEHRHA